MRNMKNIIIFLVITLSVIFASARVAYTRPGLMMRIPTSSIQKAPYIFRTGFGVELHNFDPINTAKGVYFDMEFGKGFSAGFSAVQGGDTTSLDLISESQYSPIQRISMQSQNRASHLLQEEAGVSSEFLGLYLIKSWISGIPDNNSASSLDESWTVVLDEYSLGKKIKNEMKMIEQVMQSASLLVQTIMDPALL